MKRVALIGSSGGGTATLGHTDPVAFLQTIDTQLSLIEAPKDSTTSSSHHDKKGETTQGARLVAALFISLDGGKSMDGVNQKTSSARLFQLAPSQATPPELKYEIIALGSLAQVNAECAARQRTFIAQAIRDGTIDALICVSCHVRIFQETLQAAAKRSGTFVVTGSGGTSLAQMGSLYGIQLAGNAGGSVATTSLTKAVSYTHALAVAWGKSYEPWKSASQEQRPSWTSVLNSCLPAFWGVCLTKKILVALVASAVGTSNPLQNSQNSLDWSLASLTETVVSLEHHTLPTVCAATMALSLRRKDSLTSESSLLMAAILASASCNDTVLTDRKSVV